MFGLFNNPSCPKCGRETTETGYCSPYPAFRCVSCIRSNKEKNNLQSQIDSLELKIDELTKQTTAGAE